jgi:hypothetical protein
MQRTNTHTVRLKNRDGWLLVRAKDCSAKDKI